MIELRRWNCLQVKESYSLALIDFVFIKNNYIAILHLQVEDASCASVKNDSVVCFCLTTGKWFDFFADSWGSVRVKSFGGKGFLFAVVCKGSLWVAAKSKLELCLVQKKERELLVKLMFASKYIFVAWKPFKLSGLQTLAFFKLHT